MAESPPTRKDSEAPLGYWPTAKRAALGALFFLILLIPRVRRLRRRIWVWTEIRVAAATVGSAFVWQGIKYGRMTGVIGGSLLILFALLARSQRHGKTTDEKMQEVGALVVLNGGIFIREGDGEGCQDVRIFASQERILVINNRDEVLDEISMSDVRRVSAEPVDGSRAEGPWEMSIGMVSERQGLKSFRYEGFFAEHLAGIAAATLQNLLRKDLPILPS